MRTPLALFIALSSLLAVSCSSSSEWQRYDVEPLESLGPLEFSYAGEISSTGLPEPAEFPSRTDEPAGDDHIEVRVRLLTLDREAAVALLGPEGAAMQARRVQRSEGEDLFGILDTIPMLEERYTHELSLPRGGRSDAMISNVVSYVESFELQVAGNHSIADPRIGTARDGMLLTVTTADGEVGTPGEYELALHLCELQRPIAEIDSRLPGISDSITVQTPVFTSQSLHVRASTSTDESCLLGPIPSHEDDRVMLVLVTADVVPAELAERDSAQ